MKTLFYPVNRKELDKLNILFPNLYNEQIILKTELEYKKHKYYLILILKISKHFLMSIKAIPLFLMRKSELIPSHIDYSEHLVFLNSNFIPIENLEIIEGLYRLAKIKEILYVYPFKKVKKGSIELAKLVYQINKNRQTINYPRTEDIRIKRVYEMSKELDYSDLNISKYLYLVLKETEESFKLSRKISEDSKFEDINKLKDKFEHIEKLLNEYQNYLKKRELIWEEYDLYLKEYIKIKFEKYNWLSWIKTIIFDFIRFSGTIEKILIILSKEAYNSFLGHKSINDSIRANEKKINDLKHYVDKLFNQNLDKSKVLKYENN